MKIQTQTQVQQSTITIYFESQYHMEKDSVRDFFLSIVNSPSSLQNGSELIRSKIKSRQDFVLDTIEYLSSQDSLSQQQFRQFFNIVTLLHPSLIEIFSELSEKVQEDIRGGLLNCVVALYEDLKCIGGLGLLIRELIEIDSIDPWLQPFTELLSWVSSDEAAIVQAGIQFFIFVMKETPYNKSNADLPLHKMAGPLLQVLYQLFANSQLSETIRQKLLYLVLQLVKTFSIFDGYNDSIVKEAFDPTYQIWMSFFISTLQTTVYSNIRIKKYIMKIIVIIFRDMQKYLSEKQKDQSNQLYAIWQFCYKTLPLHLWSNVWEKDINQYKNKDNFAKEQLIPLKKTQSFFAYYDEDNEALLSQTESLGLIVLEFISVLTSIPQLNTAVKISIHHLTNFLFHFMLMPEFDVQFWKNNLQQFLSANVTNDYEITIRNKALSILNQLIEKCGDYAIQANLLISEKFLLNIPESQTTESVKEILSNVIDIKALSQLSSNVYDSSEKLFNLLKLSSIDVRQSFHVSGETWKKMQVALVVLGRFAQDIIVFQSKQQGAFEIESFVKGLIKQVRDEEFYQLLKGQSLYCLTRFTEIISIKYKTLFTELSLTCLYCLKQTSALSVKVIACRALTLFLRKIDKHKLKFSQEDQASVNELSILESLMSIPLYNEITNTLIETLIEVFKNRQIGPSLVSRQKNKIYPEYLLSVFHKNISHASTVQLFFTLLEQICKVYEQYHDVVGIFVKFIQECLKSYCSILESVEQVKHLRNSDVQLILIVLKITNVLIVRGQEISLNSNLEDRVSTQKAISKNFLELISIFSSIIKMNEDIQIHIQVTICLKNLIKLSSQQIKNKSELIPHVVESIKNLLKIPKDKSFETASVYAGNLAILAFSTLFAKTNYEILQQAVLKVFRSRTPSVIQSLVLIYSRLINMNTNPISPFDLTMKKQITGIIDFLSSFSIENRMGLKILIDKWLLQQSLFRGKFAKISTFMALSKLFLLGDKRVDNLLVIGFNPSHTNISNDVTAPLKILATLIRCLDNEKGFQKVNLDEEEQNDDEGITEFKDEPKTVDVTLEKFKEERNEDQEGDQSRQGGLADRQNQQGSTCYMSAMLQFYDDGEQCDQTTEDDLIFLSDSSTNFVLADYLIEFFNYLIQNKKEYFKECLKGILKQDVKTLQKYVNLD